MNYKLIIEKAANESLIQTKHYISNVLMNPTAAEKLTTQIEKKLRNIPKAPYLYPTINNTIYRKVPIKNYIALYYIDETEKIIYITNVVYAGSNYHELF